MDIGRLLLYLGIGTVMMLIPIMLQGNWYQISIGKRIVFAMLLTITGTIGTLLLYFVENGEFGGISFFGAIFFVPILFLLLSHLLKIPYSQTMDICAPAECAMLVVMKVQCMLTGCCGGRLITLWGKQFVFPSQIVELINAAVIGIALLFIARNTKNKGRIYPIYMVIYGVCRFILNIFRQVRLAPVLHLPFGNFWAIISILVGIIWLLLLRRNDKHIGDQSE